METTLEQLEKLSVEEYGRLWELYSMRCSNDRVHRSLKGFLIWFEDPKHEIQ